MSELKTWAQMADDDAEVIACGERWKAVAANIGCTLHGFNDDYSASFTTPDGNVIEVGQKFRAMIDTRPQPSAEPVAVWLYEHPAIGQIAATERWRADDVTEMWTETPLYPASALEAARREGLEQAAKVADRIANPQNNWGHVSPIEAAASASAAKVIAISIRALKENPNG